MRKTDKQTNHSGAISSIEQAEIKTKDHEYLDLVKGKEKKLKRKLSRVPTINGYVLTNNPQKWIDYNRNWKSISTT